MLARLQEILMRRNNVFFILLFVLAILTLFVAGCSKSTENLDNFNAPGKVEIMNKGTLRITSPAFENNTNIPIKYTCQGDNVNPPLTIKGIPEATKSFVLIIDDPDAPVGVWTHWTIWNIPIISEIEENSVPADAIQGITSAQTRGYHGPCPPSGTHRYFFKLYALNMRLNIDENSTKADLESAMNGYVIDKAELLGLYKKK